MGSLDFFDRSDASDLCSLDSSEVQGFSVHGHTGADGSSFLNGLCCLGLVPTKFHTQFPDGSLPMGIYG